jgi:hypothetical protein
VPQLQKSARAQHARNDEREHHIPCTHTNHIHNDACNAPQEKLCLQSNGNLLLRLGNAPGDYLIALAWNALQVLSM